MKNLRVVGIILLVVCGVCLFVAFERYQSNASAVRAMSSRMSIGSAAEPGTPPATKYALFFGLLSGGGALCCLAAGRKDNG